MSSATSPVRVALIGLGYWGPSVLRVLRDLEDVQVAGVADLDPLRLEYARELYPELRTTADAAELLREPSVMAVVVATPMLTHLAIGEAALLAGKDVLVEKPLATTAADAHRLVTIAAERGCVLMSAEVFRFSSAVRSVERAVREGAIGEVRYVDAARMNPGPPTAPLGVLWDLAPHDLSIALPLFDSKPERVSAIAQHGNDGLIETVAATVELSSGGSLHLHTSWLAPYKVRRLQVFGSAGAIVYDDTEPATPVVIYPPASDARRDEPEPGRGRLFYEARKPTALPFERSEPLRAELAHFAECVRSRRTPLTDGSSGARIVRVLEAAQRSTERDGQWQSVLAPRELVVGL